MNHIVPMTIADVDDVWNLDKLCFHIPWAREAFVDEVYNELAYYYLIKRNEQTIAYCGFWNVAGEGHITNIAVHPDFRRQGVGSILLRLIVDQAKKLRLSLLTLEVRESNVNAQRLYGKFGFRVIGKRSRYYSDNMEDAYIMTRYMEENVE
ncbi:MAG: ribosomal protein S18-alanine N-acetyltransferase [Clostridia bacterium]|nr:ribosomal protein S18-alanine N-acetyltransferase [Clostridia bacterium]